MREWIDQNLVSWTIIPALLFSVILIPVGLVIYALSRWALSNFGLPREDQIAMSTIAAIAFVVSYVWAADFVGNAVEKRKKRSLP